MVRCSSLDSRTLPYEALPTDPRRSALQPAIAALGLEPSALGAADLQCVLVIASCGAGRQLLLKAASPEERREWERALVDAAEALREASRGGDASAAGSSGSTPVDAETSGGRYGSREGGCLGEPADSTTAGSFSATGAAGSNGSNGSNGSAPPTVPLLVNLPTGGSSSSQSSSVCASPRRRSLLGYSLRSPRSTPPSASAADDSGTSPARSAPRPRRMSTPGTDESVSSPRGASDIGPPPAASTKDTYVEA